MNIVSLPDPERHPAWGGIKALLETGASFSGSEPYEPNETVWLVMDGSTVFAALTTALCVDGAAEIRACGGTRVHEWVADFDEVVCEWARMNGASHVRVMGRRGWEFFARKLGWQRKDDHDGARVFEKELK